MLRFIIERDICNMVTDYRDVSLKTIDLNVPELEEILSMGGVGDGWDLSKLIGVEVIKGNSQ